ncbi:MAG TPA: aspartate dehydrogenase domain-containing protein [Candidatus Margulisiibacteriota bacterium]|nr:aspartate dehydrogenase domain-containing protein [Candidatus Margulisiibacteriota bacterium]
MAEFKKIGIVGCGAIGSSLARVIVKDFTREARLVALYDIEAGKAESLSRKVSGSPKLAVSGLKEVISKSDLVIEASSARSSREIAAAVLSRGKDTMLMSVGGIIKHLTQLKLLCRRYGSHLYIPSGAISGIDALKAAVLEGADKVTLVTRKNPLSFKGVKYVEDKKIDLRKIRNDRVLFYGSAEEAVKYFPQNVNVAAVLSIAGIGRKRTKVKIIASPKARRNIHEIEIESKAARVYTRTENILHPDNPKTSYLAVLAAVATLKQILEPVKIGT